jgi:hypothetical protein
VKKLALVVTGMIVGASLIVAPAEAARAKYSVSMKNQSYEYVKGKYKYLSTSVIDVSNSHRRDYVLLSGRVKGGPTKGKYLRIYATNTNDPKYRKNTQIAKIKLPKSGKFKHKVRPPRGGRWKYTAKINKSGKYRAASRTTTMDAFHWTHLYELTDIDGTPGVTIQRDDDRDYVGRGSAEKRWGDQFALDGGASVTFKTRAYRCKKLSLKTGVSQNTPHNAQSGRIEFVQNRKVVASKSMRNGDPHFDAAGSDSAARKFRDSITSKHDVTMRAITTDPEAEQTDPKAKVRFIVGNSKAFCTFPSINKDL